MKHSNMKQYLKIHVLGWLTLIMKNHLDMAIWLWELQDKMKVGEAKKKFVLVAWNRKSLFSPCYISVYYLKSGEP